VPWTILPAIIPARQPTVTGQNSDRLEIAQPNLFLEKNQKIMSEHSRSKVLVFLFCAAGKISVVHLATAKDTKEDTEVPQPAVRQ